MNKRLNLELPSGAVAGRELERLLNERLRQVATELDGAGAVLMLAVPGTLGVRSNAAALAMFSTPKTVKKLTAIVKTPPSNGGVVCDLVAGGKTMGTVRIADGAVRGEALAAATIPANTEVRLDITSVGLTTPGADLSILVQL